MDEPTETHITGTASGAAIEAYNPRAIEPAWQARWAAARLYDTDLADETRPKFYLLTMYPYPSGNLHIGHWYVATPTDALARFHRMHGENVFLPIGFDAFGLPAENAAIKNQIHPRDWTMANIANMRRQLRSMGASFAWDHEVVTCEPDYYKWSQWFFLAMLKNNLAYRATSPVDWCPADGTLAREQVEGADRHCWRCGSPVQKRDLPQWYLRITDYADELRDFAGLDWPEPIKIMQTNWIGRSEGAQVSFATEGSDVQIEVFTTRPDTLYGVSYLALAPEHPALSQITTSAQSAAVAAYVAAAVAKTEIARSSTSGAKTGVPTGAYAINPVNDERLPVWVADYVLGGVGTGAIMAVPAHDERDFEFARTFNLPITRVVAPAGMSEAAVATPLTQAYVSHAQDDILVNSGPHSGASVVQGTADIVADLAARGCGHAAINYRLRDWLISRQRYWGTPIPVVYCAACGIVPVPADQLPVRLPESVNYAGSGDNPLKSDLDFVNTTCPQCGGPAERETDTMDTFVDSSWYWFRYLDPQNGEAAIDPALASAWSPVDQYTGGAEHAVMHLLYARFFTKVLADLGLVKNREPFTRLFNQGQILGADKQRMSKSRGNVEDPDALVVAYGADAVRLFLMFMGPWDQGGPWSSDGINGMRRFLNRVWELALAPSVDAPVSSSAEVTILRRHTHKTLAAVSEDYAKLHFNTMVAHLMELSNELWKVRESEIVGTPAWNEAIDTLLLMLAPAAPHIAEELWSRRAQMAGETRDSIHVAAWPEIDISAMTEQTREIPVQINGKLRDKITVPADMGQPEREALTLSRPKILEALAGRSPTKVIHIGERIINIVVS